MMNSTVLPALFIFSLDYTLWPFSCDHLSFPCVEKNGTITDSNQDILVRNAEVPVILEKLHASNTKIAIIECLSNKQNAIDLIKIFGWDKYVSFIELEDSAIDVYHELVKKIHEKSKIPYPHMLLIYNRNVYAEVDPLFEMGVFARYTYGDGDVTTKVVNDALIEYYEFYKKSNKLI